MEANNENNNQIVFAGFWVRLLAEILDGLIWLLNFFVPLYLLSTYGTSGINEFVPAFLWFVLYVVFVAPMLKFSVHPYFIHRFGAGLGKLACGLEIINVDGSSLTYKNALFREYIAKMASNALLGLGYYWIFRNPQRQGWHDGLSGTYVKRKHEGTMTGIMLVVIMSVVIFGLSYKSFNNFKNAKTLQYDLVTLITQIRQDSTDIPVPKIPPTDRNDNGEDYLDQLNKININDIDTKMDADNPFEYGEYEKYKNMSYDELLEELEKLNTQ